MLHVHQYKKSYNSATILEIPDLVLEKGIYWLQGENGSGKTTLLKSIAGLLPYEGAIQVAGCSIQKQRIHYKKQVNHAEAEPVYPLFLTGNDLLQFYFKTKGGPKEAATELLHAFGIDKYLHNKLNTYSSGMMKKLSLVLAFAGVPKLVLLDEPLITLDAEAVMVLHNNIAEQFQNGVSFIITSHQQLATALFELSQLVIKNGTLTVL